MQWFWLEASHQLTVQTITYREFKTMLAQVLQAHRLREIVAGQFDRRQREQDLATVASGEEPGDPVERWTEVVPVMLLGRPGVGCYSDPQRAGLSPPLLLPPCPTACTPFFSRRLLAYGPPPTLPPTGLPCSRLPASLSSL